MLSRILDTNNFSRSEDNESLKNIILVNLKSRFLCNHLELLNLVFSQLPISS